MRGHPLLKGHISGNKCKMDGQSYMKSSTVYMKSTMNSHIKIYTSSTLLQEQEI